MDLLDNEKPIERIATDDYRAVARLISGLEDPLRRLSGPNTRGPFGGPPDQ
jgi:hypothetical protein